MESFIEVERPVSGVPETHALFSTPGEYGTVVPRISMYLERDMIIHTRSFDRRWRQIFPGIIGTVTALYGDEKNLTEHHLDIPTRSMPPCRCVYYGVSLSQRDPCLGDLLAKVVEMSV